MRKRLIPVLLVDANRRLVKTERFGRRTYVGDPFNVVRLFSEMEVDEICVLDIDAGPAGRAPDAGFLGELASECFMPLSYGGGITRMEQCEQLNRMGVEKFVLGHAATDTVLLGDMSRHLGSQAVTVCVDVAGSGAEARCVTRSGTQPTGLAPLDLCRRAQDAGAGEIIVQSVDRDGLRQGYDLDLIGSLAHRLDVPLVALGGAGELKHLGEALAAGASAAASGSAFVFIGRLRAVLVNYPVHDEIVALMRQAGVADAPAAGAGRVA